MPLVEGESLRDRIVREGALPLDDALQIAKEVGEALACAHEHRVVHRDIKPENILLASGTARVADFGIARARTEAGEYETLTEANLAVGTPEYMSPEQASGSEFLDHRTDIYALGCVLYEMLAGEPPFTGRTVQAIIAKHLGEKVPTLTVLRPNLPVGIVNVIEKALAKVPAGRFQTASDFVAALDEGVSTETLAARRVRRVATRLAPLALVAAAVMLWFVWPRTPQLDPNRIVAFPFEVTGARGAEDLRLGRDVAYLIVSALDNQGGVKWIEGWDRLELQFREDIRTATERDLSAAARSSRAGFFLDGQIMLGADSSRVIVALHSVEDDSRVERADTAGIRSETEHIAYRAVGKVLLSLLPDVGRVGMNAVAGRSHRAIQPFVRAEREFYYGRYREAFEHYEEAVDADSTFALAAVKAAQAASWNHRQGDAVDLIRVAIEHVETLPQRWAHFARGFEAFLNFDGDAAVLHFELAVEEDEEWADGWMGLGEAYTHLLPRKTPQDSLGHDAFLKAYERSPAFAPAIYHLTEHAIQEGDVLRATELLDVYRAADPDSAALGNLELALRCVERSPESIDWPAAVRNNPDQVYLSAALLNVRASNPECAEAAWRAVLRHDTTASTRREYSSLLGLQSLFAATGQYDELRRLVDSAVATGTVIGTAVSHMVFLDALAGAGVQSEAERMAIDLRDNPPMSVPADVRFWYLGIWETHRGSVVNAQLMSDSLAQYAVERRGCQAQFLTRSLEAHVLVARGDTLNALDALGSLQSGCRRPSTFPWFGRGLEMITHSRIYLALGQFENAVRVARGIDAPASVPNVVFLPASLQLRMRAAEEMGDEELAERCGQRLIDLGRHDLVAITERGIVH